MDLNDVNRLYMIKKNKYSERDLTKNLKKILYQEAVYENRVCDWTIELDRIRVRKQ